MFDRSLLVLTAIFIGISACGTVTNALSLSSQRRNKAFKTANASTNMEIDPFEIIVTREKTSAERMNIVQKVAVSSASLLWSVSLMFGAVAVAVENVEHDMYGAVLRGAVAVASENAESDMYGIVNAPVEIAIVGGVVAILTALLPIALRAALLPIALRSGEKAFTKTKDRDQATFGKSNKGVMSKRKK